MRVCVCVCGCLYLLFISLSQPVIRCTLSIQQFVSFAAAGLSAALGTQRDEQFECLRS